jgi:hypothetical protein
MADPTKIKAYVPWIAKEYAAGRIQRLEDFRARVKPALEQFDAYKKKKDFPQEAKDIMRLNFQTLEKVVTEYQPAEVVVDRGQATTVYEDATVRVIVPADERAACYYGQGTRWCTAATGGNNMFNYYNNQGSMYILLPKQPEYDGEKYQLHFDSAQYMNEQDDPVSLMYKIFKRFPALKDFFLEKEPKLRESIHFAPDDVLVKIGELIADKVLHQAWEEIFEWEQNDDGYYSWRAEQAIEKGYVDEEGDVDWDRVHEDDELNDYTEYNDDARRFIKDVRDLKTTNIQQIRNAAEYVEQEEGEEMRVEDMDKIFGYIVEEETNNTTLAEFVVDRIVVRKTAKLQFWKKEILGTVGEWTVALT